MSNLVLRLALAAVFCFPGFALAQKPRIKIEEAKLGLPPGRFVADRDSSQRAAPIIKRNTWAPIYLRLEMLAEYDGKAKLKIEAPDSDGLTTTLTVPLNTTFADRLPGTKIEPVELGAIPYIRTGDPNGDKMTLTVMSDPTDGKSPRELSEPYRVRYPQFRDASTYVIVSLGTNLPGFELQKDETRSGTARGGLRNGRVETASLLNVREMPDQWFGYAAADLVILTTGATPAAFLDELFGEQSRDFQPRRDALLEWVRRGGKLVISVGSNASKVAQYEKIRDILPAGFSLDQPSRQVTELPLRWQVSGGTIQNEMLRPRGDAFTVAKFVPIPAKPTRMLIPQPDADGFLDPALAQNPVVLQTPYGLGRITLVGFDLDQSPFVDSAKRADFWDWLIRESGSAKSALAATNSDRTNYGYSANYDTEDEYSTALRQHVDTFDGVPVISFGWVALFIILYTLLIGPVEYFILKKIFGRLELTWVTFPLIVLSVSAAAYFTAYAIKGNDLKINKVDLVDVDMHGNRVYGRSWFTIFSPRIDSYTVGVEPRAEWVDPLPQANGTAPLIGWMGGTQGSSSTIVSRGYSYHTDEAGRIIGDGLDRVPIQVWSTKAFTASWTAAPTKVTPPIVADLSHPPGDPKAVEGSFVANLPFKSLKDPVLFYAGTAYKIPTLTPGQKVVVNSRTLSADNDWFSKNVNLSAISSPSPNYISPRSSANMPTTSNLSMWGALFHERAIARDVRALQNASLRGIDESWRLTEDNRYEAILVGRLDTENGQAEAMMTDAGSSSPVRLWLRGLPGSGERDAVPGTLRQETYIRIYIPVRNPARAK